MSSPWSNSDAWQDDFETDDALEVLSDNGKISPEQKEKLLDQYLFGEMSYEDEMLYRNLGIQLVNEESEANWVDQVLGSRNV